MQKLPTFVAPTPGGPVWTYLLILERDEPEDPPDILNLSGPIIGWVIDDNTDFYFPLTPFGVASAGNTAITLLEMADGTCRVLDESASELVAFATFKEALAHFRKRATFRESA
jgi:hypothetical protein